MRVLVLSTARRGHLALHQLGCDVVAFIKKSDGKPQDVDSFYQRLFYFDESVSVEEYVSHASILHKIAPFDVVYSFNDDCQHIVIEINKKLGLTCHLTQEVLSNFTDKSRMRQLLQKSGLDQTPQAVITDRASLIHFAEHYGFPFIVKPLDGTGSQGISRLDSLEQIDDALSKLSKKPSGSRVGIVERFIEGEEYSVECISEKGNHHLLAITKKFKESEHFIEIGHLVPAPLSENEYQQITSYVTDVLDCLGVQDGPTHTEIILSPEGPTVIESHTRQGGDNIDKLVNLVYGINIYELTARQLIGESITQGIKDKKQNGYASIWYAIPEMTRPHILKAIKGQEVAAEDQNIHEVELLLKSGSHIHHLKDSFSRGASAISQSETVDGALKAAQSALSKLEFVVSMVNE